MPQPPRAARSRTAMTEAELTAWGTSLGRSLTAPLVITVSGEVGAGKTTLVQAICRGYGVEEDVTSPTFTVVHRYVGGADPVYHIDLYRLERPGDVAQLGWDDILSEHAITIIEWPERAGGAIPPDHIPIRLDHIDGDPDRRLLSAGGHVGAEAFGGEEA